MRPGPVMRAPRATSCRARSRRSRSAGSRDGRAPRAASSSHGSRARGVVRPFVDRSLEPRMEHHELHVRILRGRRDEILRAVVREVEALERQPLVRTEHLHPEIVGALHDGQTDRRVRQRVAVSVGTPRRVRLERCDPPAGHLRLHAIERGADRSEVGRQHALRQHAVHPAVRELAGEVRGPDRRCERHRRVRVTRVRDIGEQRDGRVAREEQVVEVVGPVEALELVGGIARGGHQIAHHRDRLRCIDPPRSVRHHVVRVDVDDQLAARPEHRRAGLAVERVRHREAATLGSGGGRRPRRARRVRAARVEDRQAERDAAGGLQEGPARYAEDAGGCVGPAHDLRDHGPVVPGRRRGQELAVAELTRKERQRRIPPLQFPAALPRPHRTKLPTNSADGSRPEPECRNRCRTTDT